MDVSTDGVVSRSKVVCCNTAYFQGSSETYHGCLAKLPVLRLYLKYSSLGSSLNRTMHGPVPSNGEARVALARQAPIIVLVGRELGELYTARGCSIM